MKRIIIMALCLGLIMGSFAQQNMNYKRILTPKQMKMAATYYFYEIERTHFYPYHVLGEKGYQRAKQDILKGITKSMAVWQFALLMGSTNSWFDGHTTVGYIDPLRGYLQECNQCLFYCIDVRDSCFFFENVAEVPDTLKGKLIVSINGIGSVDIYNRLSKYSSKESLTYLNRRLKIHFPYLYPVLYGFTDKLDILYQDGDDIRRIVLYQEDIDKWRNTAKENVVKVSNNKNLYCKFYPNDKIAILELNSFACYGENLNAFIKEINCSFDSLRNNGYEHLFLDVTRNGGGISTCANTILGNLNVPDSLRTFTAFKKGKSCGDVDTINAIFRKDRDVYYDKYVYLLQSKRTYSAAVDLCSPFKSLNLGCIIGEETGGLTAGYIDSKKYTLPYALVNFYCSFKQYCNIGGAFDGRGVLPDIEYPMNNLDRSFTLDELKQFIEMCDN